MDAQLLNLVLMLLFVGAAVGFSAGLFGIGGGAIMVPALYYTFGALGYPESTIMHMAVATSAAVIIITSSRSVLVHNAYGAVDWELLWPNNKFESWGLWISAGAFVGALAVAPHISGAGLTLLFGMVATLVALQFIFGRPSWKIRDSIPGGLAPALIGGAIGTLSALMGIGGGAISVSLMVMCGMNIHRAIGTASGIGVFISLPATVGFIISGWDVAGRAPYSLGYVNVLGFAIIALTSILCIPWGARTAHNMNSTRLKQVFGVFLLIVALNMIRKTIWP